MIGKAQDLFGPKIYENIIWEIRPQVDALGENAEIDAVEQQMKSVTDTIKEHIKEKVIAPAVESYDVKKTVKNRIERQAVQEIDQAIQKLQGDYIVRRRLPGQNWSRSKNLRKLNSRLSRPMRNIRQLLTSH